MNPISARTLLLLLSSVSLVVAATDFANCLADFKNTNQTGGVDFHGHNVSAADAVGLTYETCKKRCGTTAESFSWAQFAGLFASWLLPWFALLSQLPFGSGNIGDSILSIIMSLGSPALAAYSLVITARNVGMVNKKASTTKHKSSMDVAKVLIALQQQSHELTDNPLLLPSISVRDNWIKEILERLDKKNAWSLATASTVTWVVIAFVFTFIGSFISIGSPDGGGSDGLAVGTLWLWLLCLVVGWLRVPIYSSSEIRAAIFRSNKKTAKHVTKEIMRPARYMINLAKGDRKPNNPKEPEKSDTLPTVNFADENGRQQERSPPDVGGIQSAHQSSTSVKRSAGEQPDAAISTTSLCPETHKLLIPFTNVGRLHRDESRHPATFNYSRIMRYYVLVDHVFRALGRPISMDRKLGINPKNSAPTVFPRGTRRTMAYAAFLALLLQFGTTGAATIIIIYTPTVGLGCRSLGYIFYGGVAIIIMFLTIFSTILARISETRGDKSPLVKRVTAFFAVFIRYTCRALAILNAVGIIALCCLQFSNLLDNCYCNSRVLGKGTNAYITITDTKLIPRMDDVRAYGVVTALASISLFIICLQLISSYDLT